MLSKLPILSARQLERETERVDSKRGSLKERKERGGRYEGKRRKGKMEVSGTKSKGDSQKRERVNKMNCRG